MGKEKVFQMNKNFMCEGPGVSIMNAKDWKRTTGLRGQR